MSGKFCFVTRLEWLKRLGDPGYEPGFDLKQFPMFFDARPGWIAQGKLPEQHIVYFCLGGSFKANLNGNVFTIRTGEMIWVQPGVKFEFFAAPRESAQIARFRLRLARRGEPPVRLREPFVHLVKTGVARAWVDQIRLHAKEGNVWILQARRAALAGFFATALDAGEQEKREPRQRVLSTGQLAVLEHFVEMRGTKACAPSDLAGHLQLAPGYFNRLFRATLGKSARAWLIERRIHAAAQQLVESNRRVSEVADEFGYGSLYFFSRQFRKVMGVSPRIFRQRAVDENLPRKL